ncbi:hypothetical protein ACTHGU_16465 [Chitinophagaceae bacterium MMS25-I14]
MKRNVPVFGFILGAIFPLLGYLVVYLILGRGQTFGAYTDMMLHNHKTLATAISLSMLANLIPFMYYTNKRLDHTARGILVATMLYALVFLLVKFVW